MAKSINSNAIAPRRIRSNFFQRIGSGALKNFLFGLFRGIGSAIGFSGIAFVVLIFSTLLVKLPFIHNLIELLMDFIR